MDVIEEEQLFGAPPGRVMSISLTFLDYDQPDRYGILLSVQTGMKRDIAQVRITLESAECLHDAIGNCIPMLMRAGRTNGILARRTLWAIHNAMKRDGYNVEITGAGKPPKH